MASRQGGDLASQAMDIKGLKVLAARLDGADAAALRDTRGPAQEQARFRGHRVWRPPRTAR